MQKHLSDVFCCRHSAVQLATLGFQSSMRWLQRLLQVCTVRYTDAQTAKWSFICIALACLTEARQAKLSTKCFTVTVVQSGALQSYSASVVELADAQKKATEAACDSKSAAQMQHWLGQWVSSQKDN